VELLEILPDGPEEINALYQSGGFPLFLTRVIDEGTVEFGGSLLGAQKRTAPDVGGLLALFRFRATRSNAEIIIEQIELRTLQGVDRRFLNKRWVLPGVGDCGLADFDCSGRVDFGDFFQFADVFGQTVPPVEARFDLDGDGSITFGDFFIFADVFGQNGGPVAKLMVAARERLGTPLMYALHPNYPNPFNARTVISYSIPERTRVTLAVFNVMGQNVVSLVADVQEPGFYAVDWQGKDRSGRRVGNGVYFTVLSAGPFRKVQKLLFLK